MSHGIELFSALAEDYARSRPGYPTEALDVLTSVCGLTRDTVIADIGSGTGNLARLFLAAGYQVVGVEPNREMRESGDRLLSGYPGFRSLDGTAESIPLETDSVDLVAVGQALHWFDADRARAEFQRILRPGGWVAVLWNDPVPDATAFTQEYRAVCDRCVSTQPLSDRSPSIETGLDDLFGTAAQALHSANFQHAQSFDLDGFLGRSRSSGYVPQPNAPGHGDLTALMTDLFVRHQHEGKVEFHYTARLFVGHLE